MSPVACRWRLWVAVLLAGLAAACIPLRYDFYRPIGPGTAGPRPCMAWIDDELRIPLLQGAALNVSASDYNDRLVLWLSVSIPGDVSLALESTRFDLTSDEWPSRTVTLDVGRIFVAGPKDLPPLQELQGPGEYRLYFDDRPGPAHTDLALVREFSMLIPAMRIGGATTSPMQISFRRDSGWGLLTCAQ